MRDNAISPGVIVAPASVDDGPEPRLRPAAVMMHGTPSNATGPPRTRPAHAAVYLASDEARFVHGTVIDVDGGRVGAAVIAG